jgi:DNA-binding ferritin-like protein
MDKCCKAAALYIAALKSLALIHQQNHWTVKGGSFYGKHLLFERIYDSALENLDLAAEKFVGAFGVECIDYGMQAEFLNKMLCRYTDLAAEMEDDFPVKLSLTAEKDFLEYSEYIFNCLEEEGKMTLGIDDMIMSIAGEREEAMYLLQQSMDGELDQEMMEQEHEDMMEEETDEDLEGMEEDEDMGDEEMDEEDMDEDSEMFAEEDDSDEDMEGMEYEV